MRAVIIFLTMLPVLLVLEFFTLLLSCIHYPFARRVIGNQFHLVAYFFFISISTILRVNLHYPKRLEGLPDRFLIISNHQSYLDIPALISVFSQRNVRFVAKMELRYWVPCVTTYIILLRHAFVHRRLTKEHLQENRHILKKFVWRSHSEHFSIMVFPEGSRAADGNIRPFRGGALREILLQDPHLPVVSVALDGGHAFAKVFRPLQRGQQQHYRIEPLTVYHGYWNNREKIQQLMQIAHEEIHEQLQTWRSSPDEVYK